MRFELPLRVDPVLDNSGWLTVIEDGRAVEIPVEQPGLDRVMAYSFVDNDRAQFCIDLRFSDESAIRWLWAVDTGAHLGVAFVSDPGEAIRTCRCPGCVRMRRIGQTALREAAERGDPNAGIALLLFDAPAEVRAALRMASMLSDAPIGQA